MGRIKSMFPTAVATTVRIAQEISDVLTETGVTYTVKGDDRGAYLGAHLNAYNAQ
jgi:hypothetical protein